MILIGKKASEIVCPPAQELEELSENLPDIIKIQLYQQIDKIYDWNFGIYVNGELCLDNFFEIDENVLFIKFSKIPKEIKSFHIVLITNTKEDIGKIKRPILTIFKVTEFGSIKNMIAELMFMIENKKDNCLFLAEVARVTNGWKFYPISE